MEPKSMSFSAGLSVLVYYWLFPEGPALTDVNDLLIEGGKTSVLIGAMTAVITPFAAVGKNALARISNAINGPTTRSEPTLPTTE